VEAWFVNWMAECRLNTREVAGELERWFRESGVRYPWRGITDVYGILVAEVMLQQTQIKTVLEGGYYARWMREFPSFQALAEAEEGAVLKCWEGLGYYRRARNLKRLAEVLMEEHGGVFPQKVEQMLALPGIGAYTAGAVASFAFGQAEPLVDGNVARVLMRLWADVTEVDSREGKAVLWARAGELVRAAERPGDLNSALMELGQRICRVGEVGCGVCPLESICRSRQAELRVDASLAWPRDLPRKKARVKVTEVEERVGFVCDDEGRVLLECETGGRRTGLWKLPALNGDGDPEVRLFPVVARLKYGITRYRVQLWVHDVRGCGREIREVEGRRFFTQDEILAVAMASPYRRALNALLEVYQN
jgi:A/G-specific adenine glycosylase